MSLSFQTALEETTFGIERELEYTGHLTTATHLVPLSRWTFASSDETHIRIWGLQGDVAKTTFPSNRRSMVSAMTYCPTFAALLTTEVDMTLKAYDTATLKLIDSFSLGQVQKKGDKGSEKSSHANEKVNALVYLPQHDWVLVGGDNGCDIWRLAKTQQRRRPGSVGRLQCHLQLQRVRRVATDSVLGIIADLVEQRVVMWGRRWVSIYDTDMAPITSCRQPHTGPLHCACIKIVSMLDTRLLTGGEDGAVKFWSLHGRAHAIADDALFPVMSDESQPSASIRLEHSFNGHTRPVEVVCFYHRLERGMPPRLCVSHARDGKMKVWSLLEFSLVYTLDLAFLDSRSCVFPLGQHFFAVSASNMAEEAGAAQRTTVTLVRFTAHVAAPFATTNQSPVVHISRPPPSVPHLEDAPKGSEDGQPKVSPKSPPGLSSAVAIVSEDVAMRIVDANARCIIATLPPPPDSKVQVLSVFLCPVWQLIILWLSSREIAVFFVPLTQMSEASKASAASDSCNLLNSTRVTNSTTPLLIRRFSILEVRAHAFDKDLPKEAFWSVALHHGVPFPHYDKLTRSGFDTEDQEPHLVGASPECLGRCGSAQSEEEKERTRPDWFLVIGTKVGTLQAFRLCDILAASPIWPRIATHLPEGAWLQMHQPARGANSHCEATPSAYEKTRLQAFEDELKLAMDSARGPGQRPFPRNAPPLKFHGRWRCHDYLIEVTEATCRRLMTLDMKRNLRIWRVEDMRCAFQFRLGEFLCCTPYFQPELLAAAPGDEQQRCQAEEEVCELSGLALGSAGGAIQLAVASPGSPEEPEVLQSVASHTKAVTQVDFVWPINVFVSVGEDYAVKIWSHGLVLLRDILFPQPLTAVAFRYRPDRDVSRGHGDVLVGFASHVEVVSYDLWSRHLSECFLGRYAARSCDGQGILSADSTKSRRGLALLDASDDISDHIMWLHSDQPQEVRSCLMDRKGVTIPGAGFVSKFRGLLMDSVRSRSPPQPNEEAMARLQSGVVTDFRGRPIFEVATLAGQAADPSVLTLWQRPSREPAAMHERCDHHDRGDFRTITHVHPGYYDRNVCPSTSVDAPREHAIRGGVDADGTCAALVTSVGVGHLRIRDEGEETGHCVAKLSATCGQGTVGTTERLLANSLQPDTGQSTKPEHQSEPPRPPSVAERSERPAIIQTSSRLGPSPRESTTGAPPKAGSGPVVSTGPSAGATTTLAGAQLPPSSPKPSQRDRVWGSGEEGWRRCRIGRGVPKSESVAKPRMQNIANTEDDAAKLLMCRGCVDAVPDEPEENMLRSLTAKKAEWLYSPRGSALLKEKRRSIANIRRTRGRGSIWTPNGRLFCEEVVPPTHVDLSAGTSAFCPAHMKMRMPVTRAEVTEQRIIDNAAAPPPTRPEFAVESRKQVKLSAMENLTSVTNEQPFPEVARAAAAARGRRAAPAGRLPVGCLPRPASDSPPPSLVAPPSVLTGASVSDRVPLTAR